MTLGEKLRKLRMDRGLFQRDLADSLNISITTICTYESDDRKPKLETLKKMAHFFGVSIDYLLEEDTTNLDDVFPEGIQLMRRATNELNEEERDTLIKLIKAFLDR